MKKLEEIYREIFYRTTEKKIKRITQLELAKELKVSLSTVNLAVKNLEKIGAIKVMKMNFAVLDLKKMLYLWASQRNLSKDIIFSARIKLPVKEIEKNMSEAVFTAYSAYKFKFEDVPADYSEVYVYADEKQLGEIKKRFSNSTEENSKNPNLFVLKKNTNEKYYGITCTNGQIFVDLWNLKDWYASEFVKAMENKLNLNKN